MQMNLLRKVSLLEFRAASSSDAVKPTPCAAEFAFMGRTTSLHPGKSVLTVRALSTSLKERTVER